MSRIFLSFRKADERLIRDRLYQALEQRFGADQVFKSGVTIQPGSDYAPILRRQAAECQIMLVLIGKGWAGGDASGTRLLDRQDDWVRTEIAISLRAGNTVVPILVGDGVLLPRADELPPDVAQLGKLQFRRISESRVDVGITEIIKALIELQPNLERTNVMAHLPPEPRTPRTSQRATAKDGSAAVNAGGNNTGNVVTGRGNAGRDINNKSVSKKGHPGLYFLSVIIVIAVIFALAKAVPALLHSVQGSSLSATSTCQQFLNTDENTEQQAIVDIADANGEGGFGSPLALPEIRYECSGTPNATLGSIIQRDNGEF
jgi:hypothetical protein